MQNRKSFETALAVGGAGQTLSFGVKGYEFPDFGPEEDSYDRNWLDMAFSFRKGDKAASCKDACVLTWDVKHIAETLPRFIDSDEAFIFIEFMEPNLTAVITRLGDGTFSVGVKMCPEGKMGKTFTGAVSASQIVTERELRRAAAYARLAILRFPERKGK